MTVGAAAPAWSAVDSTGKKFGLSDFKGRVAVLDFWAEWCGPCKMMDGPLDELAGENSGKLTVAKLNVDENPTTMSSYSVM
ncbi:MAG: thioredoxin domain-containing protein, partial [Candidatus Aminicenantaceae bacterium]